MSKGTILLSPDGPECPLINVIDIFSELIKSSVSSLISHMLGGILDYYWLVSY